MDINCAWCDAPIKTHSEKVLCSYNCMQKCCSEWIPENHGSILSIDMVRINN